MLFANKRVLITGGSRGIGKAIALKLGAAGAKIAIAAKTVEPHPRLEGTIHTAAAEIRNAGSPDVVPLQVDIRYEESIEAAIRATVERFGGIDILVNNASVISLEHCTNRSQALGPDARHQCARHFPGVAGLHTAFERGR